MHIIFKKFKYLLDIPVMPYEFDIMSSMARFYTIYANCISISRVASLTTVKIVHWKRGV